MEEFKEFYKSQLLPQLRPLDRERKMVIVKGILGASLWAIIGAVGIFLILEFAPKEDRVGWLVLVALISGVLGIYSYIQIVSDKRYYKKFKITVIENIIKHISKHLNYYPTKKVPVKLFLESSLFTKPPHRYKGDDMIAGKLSEGIFVEGSELEAYYVDKTDGKKKLKTLFKGLFFISDMDESINALILIVPKDKNLEDYQKVGLKELKNCDVGGEEFLAKFKVFTTNSEVCKEVLNEDVISVITEYTKNHPKNTLMVSFKDNRLYFAVAYDKELFEPNLYKSLINQRNIEEYYDDIIGTVNIVKKVYMNALKNKVRA